MSDGSLIVLLLVVCFIQILYMKYLDGTFKSRTCYSENKDILFSEYLSFSVLLLMKIYNACHMLMV